MTPALLTITEAADFLAISRRSLYSIINAGRLAVVRLPVTGEKRAPVRVKRSDLEAFIAALS